MTAENGLPDGVVARIDVTVNGVRVNLREGMSAKAFADMLRLIADAYEGGTMGRVYPPGAPSRYCHEAGCSRSTTPHLWDPETCPTPPGE